MSGLPAEYVTWGARCWADEIGLKALDMIELDLALEHRFGLCGPLAPSTWQTADDVARDVASVMATLGTIAD